MNASDFRQLYDYHFSANRRLWERVIAHLPPDVFTQALDYSVGSIRNQCVHLASVDDNWFDGLAGKDGPPRFANPEQYPDAASVRAYWDTVEGRQRAYLATLTDDDLNRPFNVFKVWQVLLHVVNHGTDHRAQMQAMLHTLGYPSKPHDYIFFVMGRDTYA